jgi:hypothetical protein
VLGLGSVEKESCMRAGVRGKCIQEMRGGGVSKSGGCLRQITAWCKADFSHGFVYPRSDHFISYTRSAPPSLSSPPKNLLGIFFHIQIRPLNSPQTPGPTARQPLEHKKPKGKKTAGRAPFATVCPADGIAREDQGKRGEIAVQRANVVCGRCEVKECEVCGGFVAELDTRD